MRASETLETALTLLDGGKKFTQCGRFKDGEKCCSVEALFVASGSGSIAAQYDKPQFDRAISFLRQVISPRNVTDWSDSAPDFSVIEAGFKKAIELAKAEGE